MSTRVIDWLKDFWLLFGRLFPFPTKPGLRRLGNPGRSSPVLITCNFELTVRQVTKTLEGEQIDAWLLVAPTKGINVWCASGGGHFTTDAVVSIIRTSEIEKLVDHRRLILPQLSATGVNIWSVQERTSWKARFGPAHVRDLPAYLRRGKSKAERTQRRVRFDLKDRLVMGTNLGFNVALLFLLPLLLASLWRPGLWWKSLALLFVLSVLSSALAFWLPGRPGVQKGLSLGTLAAGAFVVLAQVAGSPSPWSLMTWTGWVLVLSAFVGYDMPSWSPLWRQDIKELVLGVRNTHIEISPDRCTGCHLCDIVCPASVFGYEPRMKKYEVVNLDACQACGACIENCPTDAIVNNFRAGVCSCPTCAIIEGVGAVTGKGSDAATRAGGAAPSESNTQKVGAAGKT